MPIISPTAISPHRIGGKSWSSYWATQLSANIDKQYYWYDNSSLLNVRRIKICHKIKNSLAGINYTMAVSSDAHYEIQEITYSRLERWTNPDLGTDQLRSTAYQLENNYISRIAFDGTDISINITKAADYGIFRAILFNGIFGGYTTNDTSGKFLLNRDKVAGHYYVIMQAGDYSAIHASLSSMQLYDIIYYTGSVWEIHHVDEYAYIDVDSYNSTTITANVDLFTGLSYGSYNVGVFALGTKNESSSGYYSYPKYSTTGVTLRTYRIKGSNNFNYANPIYSLMGRATHWEMSTTIKKNGTAQTAAWIPEHGNSGTRLNYHSGEDMRNWVDGSELTGYNSGDLNMTECDEYKLINISYAVNSAAATEELLKVTTEYVFTVNGINIKNTYEGLIETLAPTVYSYMMPFSSSIFNKWVSDYKQKLTIPSNGNTTNVTDGAGRKDLLIYNDSVGGDYENICMSLSIPNAPITNLSSSLTSFLYNYGGTCGKFYLLAAQNKIFTVGETYTTEINVLAGSITGLIAKVDTYIGS